MTQPTNMSEAQKEAERLYPLWETDAYQNGQQQAFLSGYEFREQREWVDVKDRLPEKSGLYLVWDNEDNAVHKMSYNNGVWRSNGCVNCTEYISHYMPLPSPPNKG